MPVILDGAQGAGAVHVDPRALGCVAYPPPARSGSAAPTAPASSGSTPRSRSRSRWSARLPLFERRAAGLEGGFKDTAARFDTPSLPREAVALSLTAIELLEAAGWRRSRRASRPGARLATRCASAAARDAARRTTLVTWETLSPSRRATGSPRPA